MAWEIWMMVLSFKVNAKFKERKRRRKVMKSIQHLGWKQSTSVSAISLPCQFDLAISRI